MIRLTYSLPESLRLFTVCAVSAAFRANDELDDVPHAIIQIVDFGITIR